MTVGPHATPPGSGRPATPTLGSDLRVGVSGPPVERSVDHVWANVRAHLPAGVVATACQLGGDRLAPHLSRLATSLVVVGTDIDDDGPWTVLRAGPDATPYPEGSFELVVIDDIARAGRPAAAVLDEAVRLCSPGGSIVVGYRLFRSSQPVRQGLKDRTTVNAVALPAARRPAFLVDPRDRASSRYFVRHMAFPYRTPGVTGVHAAWQSMRNRGASMVPSALSIRLAPGRIAVSSGAERPSSILHEVEELVRSSWRSMGMAGDAPDRLQPLLVGHRRPDTGIVTALLFSEDRGGVPIVAKMPRYGPTNPALQREDRALESVSEAVTDHLRSTLPRSLGVHEVGGTHVLLQTGVPGRHLIARTATRHLRPARLAAQFDLMLTWCLGLQRASNQPAVVDDALITERLEPLAHAGLEALGGDVRVASLLDQSLERAATLRGTTMPMVAAHGDYWAGNIMVHGRSVVGVVDWERATVTDLPIWDPVKAVGSSAYHLDRYRSIPSCGPGAVPGWGDLGRWQGIAEPQFAYGFLAMFVRKGWPADVARKALLRMFSDGRIPLGWLPVAVTFYLVRQVTQSLDSPRSVAGWGSVLQALATSPGTWADDLVADRAIHERPSERC